MADATISAPLGASTGISRTKRTATVLAWACWVVPLAVTEMAFHLRQLKTALTARQSG